MKMNIVVVELSEHELEFMAEILEATLAIGEALLVHPEPGTAMDVTEEAPLWQQLEHRPVNAAATEMVPAIAYGGEAQEVIRFMLRAASPERHLTGALEGQGSGRRSPSFSPWSEVRIVRVLSSRPRSLMKSSRLPIWASA